MRKLMQLVMVLLSVSILTGCGEVIQQTRTPSYVVKYIITGTATENVTAFGFYDDCAIYRVMYSQYLPFTYTFTTTDRTRYLGVIAQSLVQNGDISVRITCNDRMIGYGHQTGNNPKTTAACILGEEMGVD